MKHIVFIPDINMSNRFLQVLEKNDVPFHIIGKKQWSMQTLTGNSLSTHWLDNEQWNHEEVSRVIFSISKTFNLPCIDLHLIGLNETSICLLGEVVAKTGCYGISKNTSVIFRDKWEMINFASQIGINVPVTRLADQVLEKSEFPNTGVIIKPRKGVTSKLVKHITSYSSYLDEINILHHAGEYILQTFVPGTLYFVNVVRIGGKTAKWCVGKYLNALILSGKSSGSYVKNWIAETPDEPNKEIFGKLYAFNEKLMDGFQYWEGCSHTEIFLVDNEDLVLCETSARPAGFYVQEMEKYLFNQQFLFEYWAESLSGKTSFEDLYKQDKFIGLIAYTPENAVLSYRSTKELDDPFIIHRYEIPADQYKSGSYTCYIAKIIIECNNSLTCEEKLNALDSWFKYDILPS